MHFDGTRMFKVGLIKKYRSTGAVPACGEILRRPVTRVASVLAGTSYTDLDWLLPLESPLGPDFYWVGFHFISSHEAGG